MGTEAYTLGRGEVHFSKFKSGTQVGEGYRYLGNSPEWNLTIEAEMLDHYNSDQGLKVKDKSIPLEVKRSGSLILDEITHPNLSLFLFSEGTETITEAGAAVADFAISDVIPGRSYQLGETTSDPVGDIKIASSPAPVVKSGTTTYTNIDDYVIDLDRGIITIVEGGAIAEDTDLTVDYTTAAATYTLTTSGTEKVEGALKYIEYNPAGDNKVWNFPYVSISPNGELKLKSDEWQQVPLTVEVLTKSGFKAIYVNGVPA